MSADNTDDDGMNKYGVEEDGSGTKTAEAQEGRCPACGSKLRPAEKNNVAICPKCGTKPFEGSR